MVTLHYPNSTYNVGASCTLPTLVMEMLVFSSQGVVELLPALSQKLSKGSIKGLCCKGAISIDHLERNLNNRSVTVQLTSRKAQTVLLKLPQEIENIKAKGAYAKKSKLGSNYKELSLPTGKAVSIKIFLAGQ